MWISRILCHKHQNYMSYISRQFGVLFTRDRTGCCHFYFPSKNSLNYDIISWVGGYSCAKDFELMWLFMSQPVFWYQTLWLCHWFWSVSNHGNRAMWVLILGIFLIAFLGSKTWKSVWRREKNPYETYIFKIFEALQIQWCIMLVYH